MNKSQGYRDLGGLTLALKILLGLGAGMTLVSFWSSWLQWDLLQRASYTEAEGAANDVRERFVGAASLTVYLTTVVVFGVWIVQAHRNVRALGATGLRFSPGWAVGSFFVPVLNWWRPYQAMSDLWNASRALDGEAMGSRGILPLWWGLWVVSAVVGQAGFRVSLRASHAGGLQDLTSLQLLGSVVDFPLCLVAAMVVAKISRMQRLLTESETG
jgi:hypothetical protein